MIRDMPGSIDVVCHSIGSCITRYLLEVMDGSARHEQVRQLIAIGPPNNGSSLAELFCDPVIGPEITKRLVGTFVPENFDPAADVIVQACRPGSMTMTVLREAGIRPDITYRLLCAENITCIPSFFPCFEGKTCELQPDGIWHMTSPVTASCRIQIQSFPVRPLRSCLPIPQRLVAMLPSTCHIRLPRAPEVVERVLGYLRQGSANPG